MSKLEHTFELVDWLHDFASDPKQTVVELDEIRCEVRKIEIFDDGVMVAVDHAHPENDSTFLSFEPWPSLESINLDENGSFNAKSIISAEFEYLWNLALKHPYSNY